MLYLVEVGADPEEDGRPGIRREELSFPGRPSCSLYRRIYPQFRSEEWRDDLILSKVSGKQHREDYLVACSLRSMRFYELHTPVLRDVDQSPRRRGDVVLGERGEHLARVLSLLARRTPWPRRPSTATSPP